MFKIFGGFCLGCLEQPMEERALERKKKCVKEIFLKKTLYSIVHIKTL